MPQMFLTPGIKEPAVVFKGFKGAYLAISVWGVALAFIKAAIGFTLLHIRQSFWFSVFIWFNIALAAGYGFGNLWFSLFFCRPMRAAWGDFPQPPETVNCAGGPNALNALSIAALVGAVVSISTDISELWRHCRFTNHLLTPFPPKCCPSPPSSSCGT